MKKIYKEFNNIEVDINEIDSINVDLDSATKDKIKNNLKSSINVKKRKSPLRTVLISSAAALILFSIVTWKDSITAFAENIPVINSLFSVFNYEGNFEEYSKIIGEVKKNKGYSLKLDEVVMDDFNLMIVYTITCPEKVEPLILKDGSSFPYDSRVVKLNGINLEEGASGSHRIIDDYTVQVFLNHDMFDNHNLKDFDIEIDFKEVNNIKGDWKFSFNVSKDTISKATTTYSPANKLKEVNRSGREATISFDKVSFSPISTTVEVNSTDYFYNQGIIFKDENGNVLNPVQCRYKDNSPDCTVLYKFKSMEKIPNKILVEYTNPYTRKTSKTELILK